MKTFTVAGTSKEDGKIKFRAANDLAGRIAMLERCGNTEIRLIELPQEMTKPEAAEYLLGTGDYADAADVLQAAAGKTAPKAPKERKAAVKPAQTVEDGTVDEDSDKFKRLIEEKRQMFPSFTDEQLMEVVRFQAQANMKHFGDLEPNF